MFAKGYILLWDGQFTNPPVNVKGNWSEMVVFLDSAQYIQIREPGNKATIIDGECPEAIYHIALCPPHTSMSSEQCSISAVNRAEGWQRVVGPDDCSSLWMELILPERTSNRPTSISQAKHRWLSNARQPSAQRFQMHRACPLTRQTDWHTDQEWAKWTTVTHKCRGDSSTHTTLSKAPLGSVQKH